MPDCRVRDGLASRSRCPVQDLHAFAAEVRFQHLRDLGRAADLVCKRLHPEPFRTYNIDRNINYTNACAAVCDFCAFYRKVDDAEAYVLDRDARDSHAAMELVLAQPAISSQLIDNLNASMHLRALLTDVFLLGEVLRSRRAAVKSAMS